MYKIYYHLYKSAVYKFYINKKAAALRPSILNILVLERSEVSTLLLSIDLSIFYSLISINILLLCNIVRSDGPSTKS